MSESPTKIFIESGRRTGRTLANEPAMRRAKDAGQAVYTTKNGVWFAVDFDEDGNAVYAALLARPEGL